MANDRFQWKTIFFVNSINFWKCIFNFFHLFNFPCVSIFYPKNPPSLLLSPRMILLRIVKLVQLRNSGLSSAGGLVCLPAQRRKQEPAKEKGESCGLEIKIWKEKRNTGGRSGWDDRGCGWWRGGGDNQGSIWRKNYFFLCFFCNKTVRMFPISRFNTFHCPSKVGCWWEFLGEHGAQ